MEEKIKLFFRKIGENGPALIILHGVFGMSDNWFGIAKSLSEKYQVYLVDQRNHGGSPHSDEFGYELMAQDLANFLSDNNIEKPILIGHSMGGKVVMEFAQNIPIAFKKLVVVDIAPKYYPAHHYHILQGMHAIPLATVESRTQANEIMKRFEDSEGVRQFILKNLYRNSEKGHFDWKLNLPVITKEIATVGDEIQLKNNIHTPSLFITGSESSYVDEQDKKHIKQYFTHATFVEIAGAGHWVQAEKPIEFLAALNNFLDQ